MAFWVVRAGRHGELEDYAVTSRVVAVGWHELGDISAISDRAELQRLMSATFPTDPITTTRIWTGEVWALKSRIQHGDWVAIPLSNRAALAIGRIAGPYRYQADAPEDGRHQRPVEWVRTDLPRAAIDQDLLYSLGSALTVFQVRRNNAEERLTALAAGTARAAMRRQPDAEPSEDEAIDLGQFARDQITAHIGRKFRGHELARLVAGILVAEGYKTLVSPPGADGGVDIVAGKGPMGFDEPRLAVQVKSSDSPVDVTVIRELQGVMPRFGAEHGLVVAWGGFKDSVLREARQLQFSIRLWDAGDLVDALEAAYERLSPELRAELPLQRLWALVPE